MKSKLYLLLILIICFSIALSLLGSGCTSQQGTLHLFGSSPSTLDPAMARESTSLEYIVEIFSGLVCFDPDLKIIPDIAESWDITGNGTIYTFHLRQGVKFHSGREGHSQRLQVFVRASLRPRNGVTDRRDLSRRHSRRERETPRQGK